MSEDKIASIVERVVSRLDQGGIGNLGRRSVSPATPTQVSSLVSSVTPAQVNPPHGCGPRSGDSANRRQNYGRGELGRGVFSDIDSAVVAAREAFVSYSGLGLGARYRIVDEIRRECRKHVDELARLAVDETGLGRFDQKQIKNRLVIDKTPGPEILEPWAKSGDDGLTLEEYAPYGVIGAITPTTNPSETIICNGLGMIAAGNAVVFNAHPSAKRVSVYTVQIINDAIVRAGGPANLLCCTAEPTIESAQQLMTHPGIRLLVVTGGPGVVKAALVSGKKCIAGGPGNPPVVVDETADIEAAGAGIVKGVALDNNIVCTAEKEIIAVATIADDLKQSLNRNGAYELSPLEVAKVEKLVVHEGHAVKEWVGQDIQKILGKVGIRAPQGTLIAYAEVPENHPFIQSELLMPVTGLVRVSSAREAIEMAVRCEHGNGHTAGMWSKNIDHLHMMARLINTSIFIKNAPFYAGLGLGGEGYTSFTIASPTGEGLTTARDFSRARRCTLSEHFRIV
ncbi:MAG: aldehyde dehydrogenase family protein [Myxococcota bacterium]|nr:aldehyde dehydrogenase family protein [Myxococcota bacterium]